jgi:sulfur carrier protein ThiS
MSVLTLSRDDRDYLERLAKRRMTPTRRQKAIALLLLAEGLTAEEAAAHAGIRKEQVAALADRFAQRGLTGVGLLESPEIRIRLVRPGVGIQTLRLTRGSRISDLLDRVGADTTSAVVYLDDVIPEETSLLRDGAVVMIIPQPAKAVADKPWHARIPALQDEELAREYTEALEARRRSLGPEDESPSE